MVATAAAAAPADATLADLGERCDRLAVSGRRTLLGLTGAPGAGKSSVAVATAAAVGAAATVLPMDGFHLADCVLDRLGRRERKGAIDTFDAAGFRHLLQRLRDPDEVMVYAPIFVREQEQAIAGALAIPADVPLVIVEGNYLLADGPFRGIRKLLDETWFLDLDPAVRRERLVARHMRYGRTSEEAIAWVEATDEPNARMIDATRVHATRVARIAE